ncbi:phage/plasmid primase, P4 family [Streptomyces nigrescens]|uniref:phage/plasmid primase, P4 family n=1 Tax=Streptomyces nigrescens TaxID=1920 RepID=UPI00382CAAC6
MLLSDLLSRFADVSEEMDGGYLARCPAHGDSRPSLRIWRGDDLKVRLTCRAGCQTEDVIKSVNLPWSALFNVTGEGAVVPKEKPQLVGPGPVAALAQYIDLTRDAFGFTGCHSGTPAISYAADRFGLSRDQAFDLGVGEDFEDLEADFPYRSNSFRQYPRLTVPLYDFNGVARGLQGRDLSGECPGRWLSLMNPKGARWSPYGVFRGQGGYRAVIVTEGPGDGLSSVSVGYDAVIIRGAALAGSPELMAELAEGLRGQQVIAAGDNDPAGQQFNRRLADGLSEHGITVFEMALPLDKDDITKWRERDPDAFPAAFHAAVKAAKPVTKESAAVVDTETGALVPDGDDAQRAVALMSEFAKRYGSSDVLNAHALVAFTGGRIKYASGLGFYVWNGVVWEQSETRVRQAIHYMGAALTAAADEKSKDAQRDDKDDPGKFLRKISKGFTTTRAIDNLMRELRAVPSVYADVADFDAKPELLSFRNGTVDLRSGRLRPHEKSDMITQSLAIDYNPDAKCPGWEKFLREIFPSLPELPSYVQRLVGYGLTGYTSEQCFAVLWGKGANGKSVLTDALAKIFKAITKNTPFATFEDKASGGIPNDIAALRDARLVMSSEGESGKPMSEAILKRASGGDEMTARFMRKEFFTFTPKFLIMLATNHQPKFRGQDEGLWRRVKLVPFRRYFAPHEREDRAVMDRRFQVEEAEGIAAWAVRGAAEWLANGLQDPAVITEATKEYRETSDALAGFFPGVIVRCKDDCQMPGSDAFNAYLDWCEAENLPSKERWSRRAFYSAMAERQVTSKKTNKGIALQGVCLAEDEQAASGPGIFATD